MSLAQPKNVVPFSSLWAIVLFYRSFYNSLMYNDKTPKFLLMGILAESFGHHFVGSCTALLTDEYLVSSEIIYGIAMPMA